ncbi:protein JTB [Ixodes scapularis]|nr:protein JTB [Ixodes scapularis]
MIEVCSLKRIIFLTVFLIGACLMILTLESILSDHDGNHNMSNSSEGCWEREDYVVKQKCVPCTEFERASKHLPVCIQSKYKELVTCKASGDAYRKCENENEAQRFWIFEGSVLVTGLFSSLSVVFRRKHLDRKMMERIQQQVAAGV